MDTEIIKKIQSVSVSKKFPDGSSYRSISIKGALDISKISGIHTRLIEIAALENNIVPERYARNFKAFSLQDQAILLKSTVSVVGLGGLGGTVVEILARAGIGFLNLIDGDIFEENNLNRQLLSKQSLLGKPKAEAARQRVWEINPSTVVRETCQYLDADNARHLLKESDVVVDCLDTVTARFTLESASRKLNRPLVSAAVAGASGHVISIFPDDPGFRAVYGEEELAEAKGAEALLGCLPHAVLVLASLECSEVTKILLNKGQVLRNRLLVVDLTDNTFEVVQLDT